MIPSGLADRPTCQWEPARDSTPLTLRLFGSLGARELRRVVDMVREGGRSLRENLCIDFEGVEHLDYRALPELVGALTQSRSRGAFVWFVGLNPYLRSLFHVSGQGPALGRLEWRPRQEPRAQAPRAKERPEVETHLAATEPIRLEAWSMAGI
jgi:ABC-type transporter Mla MlaB component